MSPRTPATIRKQAHRAGAFIAAALLGAACVGLTAVSPSPSASLVPSLTPLPTATPTLATRTPTPAPTATSTTSPTATPTLPTTASPTAPPTAAPTASPTVAPPPTSTPGGLNVGAEPNFGTITLDSGFLPDPHDKEIISGGSTDAGYLGGGCAGYVTSAPDYAVQYNVVGFPTLLRFFFEGAGDTTLVIYGPEGEWLCNDDSYDTVSPTVDINDPSSGRYVIWVGSYVSGQTVFGTLSITELDSNHPSQ